MRYLIFPFILAFTLLAGCQNGNEPGTAKLPDACYQPPESGMCKASIPRYYYDADTGACQSFIWGGCKGSVPFETMDACVSTCNATASSAPAKAPVKEAP